MSKNIITIIPARGESKGLPRKNVLPFNGKPLVVHSINYAKECDLVNTVYVSTDDNEISLVSSNSGASIIQRPSELSGDTASTESAIEHVLLTLKVAKDDMGKIIGKSGQTAKALRTLLRIVGSKNNARVNLKIVEPEGEEA